MKAWMSSNFSEIPPPTPVICPWASEKSMYNVENTSSFIFDRIFFILAGKEDNHHISDKFEFQPDSTKDYRVSCP